MEVHAVFLAVHWKEQWEKMHEDSYDVHGLFRSYQDVEPDQHLSRNRARLVWPRKDQVALSDGLLFLGEKFGKEIQSLVFAAQSDHMLGESSLEIGDVQMDRVDNQSREADDQNSDHRNVEEGREVVDRDRQLLDVLESHQNRSDQ